MIRVLSGTPLYAAAVRVGVYIDGLNLYYGGRHLCGRGTHGWRWLDVAALADRLIGRNADWSARQATARRIMYCTAPITGGPAAEARERQQTYLKALLATGRVSIEEGTFVTRRVTGGDIAGGVRRTIMVREEKGSDVNVASHLLIDLHSGTIDAAVLITNDSDLRLPARHARLHLPLGTVNPRGTPTAAALRGKSGDGAGGHWWYSLTADDFLSCQLSESVGTHRRPDRW